MMLYNKKLVDDEKAKYKEYLDFMLKVTNPDHNVNTLRATTLRQSLEKS